MKQIAIFSLCVGLSLGESFLVSERIIGGDVAKLGQFPYIVSLRQYREHKCGGSIIKTNYILTAAHCCNVLNENSIIVAGTTTSNRSGQKYKVSEINIHPEFNSDTFINDICLLRLSTNIKENDVIKIIPWKRDVDDSAQKATVAGWGMAHFRTNRLLWLSTNIVPHQKCLEAIPHSLVNITESHICSFNAIGKGACFGDSGGPLVTYDNDSNPILTGIMSKGIPCAKGYPDIYTKVGSYDKWIQEIINK